jgi:hypothetical protein
MKRDKINQWYSCIHLLLSGRDKIRDPYLDIRESLDQLKVDCS